VLAANQVSANYTRGKKKKKKKKKKKEKKERKRRKKNVTASVNLHTKIKFNNMATDKYVEFAPNFHRIFRL